jgi:glutamate/tyrosine decarboxylase-like PLP-dependent enzyme
MRRTGYAVVDLLVEALCSPAPVTVGPAAAALATPLAAPPPELPESFERLLARVRDELLPAVAPGGHPAFFGYIPYGGTWPSALADLVASGLCLEACLWNLGAGAITLELGLVAWLARTIGYGEGGGGIFLSGGSTANLTALACAREQVAGGMSESLVLYASDQAHCSVARAARALGFAPGRLSVLPSDRAFRLEPATLARAIEEDRAAGLRPLALVANAGATSTGAIDPLAELAALCAEQGLWLHVDGAYGGAACLCERGRRALAGIELADSVALDPHKWLYQPFHCGCLLVRESDALPRAFASPADYLQDASGDVSLGDRSLELTRGSRALKLWWSLHAFGVGAFRRAVDDALDLAALAVRLVEQHPALELLAPPSLGVVCFRRRLTGDGDDEALLERANAALVAALERSGLGFVSSTRLRGRYALRLCVMNHTSRAEDVERVVAFLGEHDPGDAATATG